MKIKFSVKNPKIVKNLKHLIKSSAEMFGDKDIYVYRYKKNEIHYTYNQHYNNMNYLGTSFAKIGLMEKRIAVIGDMHPAWINTYFATVNGGGVIIPLDKEISENEIINFLNMSDVSAVVYTECYNNRLIDHIDKLPNVKYFIPITIDTENRKSERIYPYDDLIILGRNEIENGNKSFLDYDVDMEKMCSIIFTSGTTGTSKGVMLNQRNLTTATNSSCQSIAYDERNTFVSVLPPHHTYEFTCTHLAATNLGCTTFLNDSLKYVMKNFLSFRPNSLILVPLFVETMYKKIWDEIDKKGLTKKVRAAMKISDILLKLKIDIRDKLFSQITDAFGGNLTSIVCGGAPLSTQLIKDFECFGITILEGYGITECSPLVSVNTPTKIRFHSVGIPVHGCKVKIDKNGNKETGEILVKGDNVMLGYYNNEQATVAAFTNDGWFKTGDIGYVDDDNYIFITGRKKNIIILSNGKNVFPEEIEEHLLHNDIISECVVIGRRKASTGDPTIVAVIYPNLEKLQDKSEIEIYDIVKDSVNKINKNLPLFKQVHDIEIRKTEFEKTTSKKIKRYKIN